MARVRRFGRVVVVLGGVLLLGAMAGGLYLRGEMRRSLPLLDGTVVVEGLVADVTIERDALGVPTITAASREDAARALGFLHAQDRFFQMDLQRRQAGGELAALVGARAVPIDRASRLHRFRPISRTAAARTSPAYRAILEAYAAGVNAGLRALAAPPPEYLVLRQTPAPWMVEDTILTILAMFNTLQGRQAQFEATIGTLAETMPPAFFDFLTARGSEWDAPVTGGRFARPPIPGPDVYDLRTTTASATRHNESFTRSKPAATNARPELRADRASFDLCASVSPAFAEAAAGRHSLGDAGVWPCLSTEEAAGLGSNNWAVAGSHTASGAALVANDMHLAINVPNIWYRASIVVPDTRAGTGSMALHGVTLPGLPSMIVGSNGHIAWGFTNTGGDWSDLVVVEPDPSQPGHYRSPGGSRAFDAFTDPIHTPAGPEPFESRWTIWGPIVGRDHRGRELAQRWVAHDAELLASDITAPERARTVEEALAVAAGLGMPAQNFVVGDRGGRIAWTIAGPIPNRVGFDGLRPQSWADGSRRWDGYLRPDAFPRIVDPSSGRLWTANAPVVEGEALATIGEGGYADGIRARLIRDRLLAIEKATPAEMLAVQLDDTALFHDRWRTLLLELLTPAAIASDARRAEFRSLVEATWSGRAEPASAAYRLVRTFRATLARQVFARLTEPARRADPDFDYSRALRSEGPLWPLVTERPLHLVDPQHGTWEAELLAAVDAAIGELGRAGSRLADRTWGEFNRAAVAHPLGATVPGIGAWLNMPPDPLPGDIYTPRAHSPRAGPSERLVVSPGREHEGILHMPTGQSGHPLSPHYHDQHRAWLTGEPLPLLPGPTVSRLQLVRTAPRDEGQ
jgi:penicillin amidase